MLWSISTDSRNGLRREVCPSVREDHGVPVRFFLYFLLVVERTLALTTRNCFLACWYSLDISLVVRVVLLLIRLLVLVERTHSQLADHALLLVERTRLQLAAHAYSPQYDYNKGVAGRQAPAKRIQMSPSLQRRTVARQCFQL